MWEIWGKHNYRTQTRIIEWQKSYEYLRVSFFPTFWGKRKYRTTGYGKQPYFRTPQLPFYNCGNDHKENDDKPRGQIVRIPTQQPGSVSSKWNQAGQNHTKPNNMYFWNSLSIFEYLWALSHLWDSHPINSSNPGRWSSSNPASPCPRCHARAAAY